MTGDQFEIDTSVAHVARVYDVLLGGTTNFEVDRAMAEQAQQVAPDSHIVYVDNDPVMLAHAHQLLESTPEGATAYLDADVHDPDDILQRAADTLDFGQPVAVMLISMMHLFPDDEDPWGLVGRFPFYGGVARQPRPATRVPSSTRG